MKLAVHAPSVLVHQLEGVRAVAVHVPIPVGNPPVAKEEGHLVGGLWAERDEVPEHVGILQHHDDVRDMLEYRKEGMGGKTH